MNVTKKADPTDDEKKMEAKKTAYEDFVRNGGFLDKDQMKFLVIPECPKNAKERGKTRPNPSKPKLELAFMCTIVSDIVQCLIKYGFDPDIPEHLRAKPKKESDEPTPNRNLKAWFAYFRYVDIANL